jgi:hypothetical protein
MNTHSFSKRGKRVSREIQAWEGTDKNLFRKGVEQGGEEGREDWTVEEATGCAMNRRSFFPLKESQFGVFSAFPGEMRPK